MGKGYEDRLFFKPHMSLLEVAELILTRLDLEARERDIFPCAALREDLRQAIANAKEEQAATLKEDEDVPNQD